MKLNGILTGLFYLLILSCSSPDPNDTFFRIAEIEGNWSSYSGIQFNESWKKINDSLLTGKGYSLNGTDTAFSEQLVIKRIADSIYYGAYVAENNGFIWFRLTDTQRNKWTFTNPVHDYPNIIEYKLINDSLLEATTSNIRGNKRIEFKMKKVN